MKITLEQINPKRITNFKNIEVGEEFLDILLGCKYMKCKCIYTDNPSTLNAVNLSTGQLVELPDTDSVLKLDLNKV